MSGDFEGRIAGVNFLMGCVVRAWFALSREVVVCACYLEGGVVAGKAGREGSLATPQSGADHPNTRQH